MGMVKLWPLIESEPLNRLRSNFAPRDEHVTQNLCQSTVRERLGKYVKYKALSFFILIYLFPRTRLLKRPVDGFWRTMAQITRNHARKCFLVGPHDDRPHFRGKMSQNRQNWALICTAEPLSCASMKIDVIEEWRHFLIAALSTNFWRSLPNIR